MRHPAAHFSVCAVADCIVSANADLRRLLTCLRCLQCLPIAHPVVHLHFVASHLESVAAWRPAVQLVSKVRSYALVGTCTQISGLLSALATISAASASYQGTTIAAGTSGRTADEASPVRGPLSTTRVGAAVTLMPLRRRTGTQ